MSAASPIAAGSLTTGIIFALLAIGWAIWVSVESQGYDHRDWHRPLIGVLTAIATAFLLVATWVDVFS